MIPAGPLFHKPKDIIAAKNILYATVFLGILGWVINGVNTGFSYVTKDTVIAILGPVLAVIILLLLIKQIGLGKKWARTVYLILFIARIVLFSFRIVPFFQSNLLLSVLLILQVILQILALKFLFSQESTIWFNKVRSTDQLEPSK